MFKPKSIIERAYELARHPDCHRWPDVAKKLKAEGYELVDAHFHSERLKKDIDTQCNRSDGSPN
ncbi:MAG: hypothetical protein EOP21_05460 [Hyphomicrobiales bacterium]|nr:MAG: hypothetical protein EOP21_05460 [Hyphomicrobiales bacterium]